MNEKQLIRKYISTEKKSLTNDTTAYLSKKICCNLIKTEEFQRADCIALYNAMQDEVQTSEIIEKWYKKKNIVLPVISDQHLFFHKYKGKDNMFSGVFGIQEPVNTEHIPAEKIDLFVVPGIAFDRNGNRLGRGKGFYDRYLSGIDKPAIGICFGFQLLEYLPFEKHDIKMNTVITENLIISNLRP